MSIAIVALIALTMFVVGMIVGTFISACMVDLSRYIFAKRTKKLVDAMNVRLDEVFGPMEPEHHSAMNRLGVRGQYFDDGVKRKLN